MRVELVGAAEGERTLLTSLPALVGRDGATAAAPEDLPQGGYHCLIGQVHDQLVVWDLGSPGGTFVNGDRVTRATLKSSDTLRLGGTDFSVRYQRGPLRYLHGVRS
jgi:hypothetical protein